MSTENICYLVYAYYGGFLDKHNYPVGIFSNYEVAKLSALKEQEDRAGKYGITIYRVVVDQYDQDLIPAIIEHFSSYNKESLPLEKIAYNYLEHNEK